MVGRDHVRAIHMMVTLLECDVGCVEDLMCAPRLGVEEGVVLNPEITVGVLSGRACE